MTAMIELPDGPDVRFRVRSFHYRDGLNRLFELELEVVVEDGEPATHELIGKRLVFNLGGIGHLAVVRGIIRSAHHAPGHGLGSAGGYYLEVGPSHWLTTQRRNNRIFQDRSVPEIVEDVLGEYESVPAPIRSLRETYPRREYTTQFGETDYDFLARLLAEEGIATFYDHHRESNLVLSDEIASTSPEMAAEIVATGAVDVATSRPTARSVEVGARLQPGATTYRDYDFARPAYRVEGGARAADEHRHDREHQLESYEYHFGAAQDGDQATRRSRQTLEAARVAARRVVVSGNFAVAAGVRVRVEGHHRDELADPLLVLEADFSGMGDANDTAGGAAPPELGARGVYVRCECISTRLPYRPARLPRPQILGTHTATVVPAEPGEEIDVDEHGRVLVLFPWDRRERTHNTSRRVRVSQGWAGPDYGFLCLPRVGDEVIVEFLGCDPDQPVVTGRLFNGLNRAPLQLPEQRTRSIWRSKSSPGGDGYNEIMLEDRAGHELVQLRAQRNLRQWVGVDSTTEILHDRSTHVHADTRSRVDGSHEETIGATMALTVGEDRNLRVEKCESYQVVEDRTLAIDGNHTVQVAKNAIQRVQQSHTLEVQEDSTTFVGGNVGVSIDEGALLDVSKTLTLAVGDKIEIRCGSTTILVESSGDVTLSGVNELRVDAKSDIKVVSNGAAKVQCDADVELTAGGNVVVRGGAVSFN